MVSNNLESATCLKIVVGPWLKLSNKFFMSTKIWKTKVNLPGINHVSTLTVRVDGNSSAI